MSEKFEHQTHPPPYFCALPPSLSPFLSSLSLSLSLLSLLSLMSR